MDTSGLDRSGSRTLVLEEVGFVSEGSGDKLGQHGEVCGVVGTSSRRVEWVVASSPHGALIRHQLSGRVLMDGTEELNAASSHQTQTVAEG